MKIVKSQRARLGAVAACVFGALASGVASEPAPAATAVEGTRLAQRTGLYDIWAAETMRYQHQPGVVVGLVHDGELVWSRGYGVRDLESGAPVTAETAFRVGSLSKLFTAVAVLHLRDAGRLRLDDPLLKHLPWLRYENPFEDAPPITIRHLLVHTSGLPREVGLPTWTNRRFPDAAELREVLAGQRAIYPPGREYKYSNLGFALLGQVVEAASGVSYDEYVTTHILRPLGMEDTSVSFDDVDPTRLATGYLIERDGERPLAPPTRARAMSSAANLTSTLEDLARFVAAQFVGGPDSSPARSRPRVLAEETLREMQQVQWLSGSWGSGRGLGFSISRRGERTLVGHGGWVAGYRTQLSFDPEARVGVIVLTNSDEGGPGSYVRRAFEVLVPALENMEPAHEDPASRRYLGTYRNPWGEATHVLVVDDELVLYDHGYPPSDDLLGGLVELIPAGEHRFVRTGANGNGEPVVFELGADEAVVRVKVGEDYLFPDGCGEIDSDLECRK